MTFDQKSVGRYQILAQLGQGGMGTVYRVYDPDLDREVAIKFLTPPNLANNDEWFRRFQREIQITARLNHPHIATVHDVDFDHTPPYVVIELLMGGTLRERLQAKPLPWREALTLLYPLGQALAYAHQAGVIHRDVKPANVMFTGTEVLSSYPMTPKESESLISQAGSKGTLKLVDFGLARWQKGESLTESGSFVGTPAYLSPEQAKGERVDARADIFALGIILFEAIAGHNPLDKDQLFPTIAEIISDKPLDLSALRDKAPPTVVNLIERAVAREREQRYPTVEALLADLAQCLDDLTSASITRSVFPPPVTIPSERPIIKPASHIDLTAEERVVLQTMFSAYDWIAIEAEFGRGLSGSRVFRVRLVEEDKSPLPVVVKVGSIQLIQQERWAYQTRVKNSLPSIARLETAPTLPPGSLWDGLCYTLVGGGVFKVQSLGDYYREVSADHLRWVLEERLFKILGLNWWLVNKTNPTFQMQMDYDALLPVNLLIRPIASPPESNVHHLGPGSFPPFPITAEDYVHLQSFVVIEVDLKRRQVTLNLPPAPQDQPAVSYRLRLENVSNIGDYRVGNVIDSLYGQVITTRQDLLIRQASQVLGSTVDLSGEQLSLPLHPNVLRHHLVAPTPPASLPNPLLAYQDILPFQTVKVSTIHGDLNLENVLVDPVTREVTLIDFAAVRQGHVLHDLLHLETAVVTKLIPPALVEAGLPSHTIWLLYQQLHQAMAHADPVASKAPHPSLDKPLAMLLAIRTMARDCLFNSKDWAEYYQGLSLYLLGALKFSDLDELPEAPLPKQVAFWGAATAVGLLKWTENVIRSPLPEQRIPSPSIDVPPTPSGGPDEPARQSPTINIGGSVRGHMGIGQQITQFGDISGQLAIGAGHLQTQPTAVNQSRGMEADLAKLREALAALRVRIEAEAPAEKKNSALERVMELEEAITAAVPDLNVMSYVQGWFIKHIPAMAEAVSNLVVHPIVIKWVEAAGEALAVEFHRRFG